MSSSVLCFGEILWDLLPHGAFPGGAPFNVAYHLHRLGVPVLPVSAVGSDDLGSQLLRRLDAWGISPSAITLHPTAATGTVTAIHVAPDDQVTEGDKVVTIDPS